MTKPIIPEFECEVVEAGAKKWHGDDEKVATTSLKSLDAHGVCLISRYSKAGEYKHMIAMVEGVEEGLRKFIESIFCDSKAQACYSVTLETCSKEVATEIACQLEDACKSSAAGGGHNGMSFHGDFPGNVDRDPWWSWGDE